MTLNRSRTARERRPVRRRRNRRNISPGAAIAIGGLIGVALIGIVIGIWFIVDRSEDGGTEIATKYLSNVSGTKSREADGSPVSEPKGGQRNVPAQPNWVPDSNLLTQLGDEVSTGGYVVRLPKAAHVSRRKSGPHIDFWLFNGGKVTGMVKIAVRPIGNRDRLFRELQQTPRSNPDAEIKVGQLKGIECIQWRWQNKAAGALTYNVVYNSFIGNEWVSCGMISTTPPGTHNYQLLETAIRTIRKR